MYEYRCSYRCSNDKYDPTGDVYSLDEFLEMCEYCFGEAVCLESRDYGDVYVDDDGEVVLRRVRDD